MKINFETTHELLKRASPAKPGKRFVSFCIDFVIVFFVSYLIFLGGFQITKNSGSYHNAQNKIQEEVKYYNELFSDTKVVEFIDEEKKIRKDEDVLVLENACRAILHAYNHSSDPDFVIPEDQLLGKEKTVSNYGEASLDNDTISYFYTNYVVNHGDMQIVNFHGQTPLEYLYSVYNTQFESKEIFLRNNDGVNVPMLTSAAANKMYHYLFVDENDDLGNSGKDVYFSFYTGYSNMLSNAEILLVRSEPYYTTHYLEYRAAFNQQGQLVNYTLLSSMVCGYLLAILLPKLLLKDERTIGRLVMKLGVIVPERERLPWYIVLIHSILGAIGFMSTMLFMYLLPPFNGIYDFIFIPLFANSKVLTMAFILVIIAAVSVINYVSTLFMHYKTSVLDLIGHSYVVDLKHIDEGDFDDQYEGKTY